MSSFVQALIIETLAVLAILALFANGRAELRKQEQHTELHQQSTSQSAPPYFFLQWKQ